VISFSKKSPVIKDTKRLLAYMEINHSFTHWFRHIKQMNWIDNRIIVKTIISENEKYDVQQIINALLVWANDNSLQDKQIQQVFILDKNDKQIRKVKV